MDDLQALILRGRSFTDVHGSPAWFTRENFLKWDADVAKWVATNLGNSHLSSWSALQQPMAVAKMDNSTNLSGVTSSIENAARARMNWLTKYASVRSTKSNGNEATLSSEVFVVHGHDNALREATARFIEKIGLKPIILHEQPNKGRTVIEKFTEHSSVAFAVVLLTGDDRGGKKGTRTEDLKDRARQNVILELGFFIGKLGRSRVCPLYEPGVELPTDFDGVVYIPIDEVGAWKLALAKELKVAGMPVDLNDVV